MLDLCTPEIQVFPDAAVFPEADSMVGRERFESFLGETSVAWVRARYLLREASEVGHDRVLIRGDWGGKGAASGIETLSSLSAVYTLRHGQISKAEFFFDHDRALEAAGLVD